MNGKEKTSQKRLSVVKGIGIKELRKFIIFCILFLTVFVVSNPVFAFKTSDPYINNLGKSDTNPETASPTSIPILADSPTTMPVEPTVTVTEIPSTQTPDFTETPEPATPTETPTIPVVMPTDETATATFTATNTSTLPPTPETPTNTLTPTSIPTPTNPSLPASASALDSTIFSFVTLSDAQDDGANLPATANQALALNPNFGIFIGDLEDDGVTNTMMNVETSALGSLYPKMLFVRGNHDDHQPGSAGLWQNYFVTANRPLPAGVTNLTLLDSNSAYLNYSFDYGNSRFIGLDVPGDADLLTTSQLNFLDVRLTNAENIGLIHAFIFFHGPPYCTESTHCNCTAKSDSSCTPSAFISVINKHPIVDATFDGHEHLLAWTHMDNSRVANLTHPYEQFLTSPSGTGNYNQYVFPNRVDYANLQNAMAFGSVTVNGASFTVNFYRVGTTTPVWSKTFSQTAHPTVTINQGASQSDPTYLAPIVYDVVFSEPVTGFSSAGVSVTGTATGTKTIVIAGSNDTYTVSISGMSASGTVIAAIKANAAQDAAGLKSIASTSTDNTVTYTKTAVPGIPILTSLTMQPKNGALVTSLTPTFTWGAPNPGAAYYRIQVSTSYYFTSPVINQTNILTTSYTPSSALAPGRRYYWRVQGVNVVGVAGGWGSTHYFQTPLSTPVLVGPGTGEALLTDRPDFDWADVTGATQYNIQIASNSKFSILVVNKTVATSGFTLTSDLPQNKLLYWRVMAKTAYVSSAWSEVRSFTSGNPPSVPSPLKPANKAISSDYTPLFDWSNSAVVSGVTFDYYQIQVASDTLFTTPVINEKVPGILNSTYTPSTDLTTNTLFYWRVRSFSSAGHYSGWSTVFSFRTTILPTTLSSPAGGSTVTSLRPTLDWADVAGASSYTIQVSRYSTFLITVVNRTVTASEYTPTSDLPRNTRLYWRVMTKTAYVSSVWSEVRSFTSGNPPSVPSLYKPANKAITADYTPLFDWSNSSVPPGVIFGHYQIQIASDLLFTAPVIDKDVPGITNSTFTPSTDLDANTTFYWRVRSISSIGHYSTWSTVFSFRTTIPSGGRLLKYYLADRVLNYGDFSKLANWGINTAMVDFDVNGKSTDWGNVFTEAAKYGISIVIWPSDWNDPRPNCDWEAPFPISVHGDITKIKPLFDVASTYPNFIGVVNGHEPFWSCTNMTIDEMAGLKSQLKAYALSKGRVIKVWNYINRLQYDSTTLPDDQISRIMDVAVTWKHCAGNVEGPCDTGNNSALAQIISDRARITNAGLDSTVDLVYIIQTFTTSGYNAKFTLPQLENYSCEFLKTNGLDGFGYYTWDAGWWPDLHSWTELQPAIPYVYSSGNCR